MSLESSVAKRSQFRHSLDERKHLLAEMFLQVSRLHSCVFDGVVEEAGGDATRIKTGGREKIAYLGRVYKVRVARKTLLVFVRHARKFIRLRHECDISRIFARHRVECFFERSWFHGVSLQLLASSC